MPAQFRPGVKPVRKTLADGSITRYFYHRATGRRLPGTPGASAFEAAVREIEKLAEPATFAPCGTIADLIRVYQADSAWIDLKASMREVMQFHITAIERAFGGMLVGDAAFSRRRKPRPISA